MYDAIRMRQSSPVTRRLRTITVVSWLGGAVSVLPFAAGWFELSERTSNLLLFSAIVSSFGLGLAIGASPTLQRVIVRLAGPVEQPSRALVLVAVVAAAGLAAMLAGSALAASL